MLVGRSSQASGYTADIDLSGHDPDKTLSRKHARITRSKDGVFLKEEEGRNGTFVNGTRVGPGQTVRLEEGDRIRSASSKSSSGRRRAASMSAMDAPRLRPAARPRSRPGRPTPSRAWPS